MIKITIQKESGQLKKIQIHGHAMYDTYGKDIVCAAVSSILTTTVNAILRFDENAIHYDDEKDFRLEVQKQDTITSKLLDNMIDLWKELESQYPKNIKIREDE